MLSVFGALLIYNLSGRQKPFLFSFLFKLLFFYLFIYLFSHTALCLQLFTAPPPRSPVLIIIFHLHITHIHLLAASLSGASFVNVLMEIISARPLASPSKPSSVFLLRLLLSLLLTLCRASAVVALHVATAWHQFVERT